MSYRHVTMRLPICDNCATSKMLDIIVEYDAPYPVCCFCCEFLRDKPIAKWVTVSVSPDRDGWQECNQGEHDECPESPDGSTVWHRLLWVDREIDREVHAQVRVLVAGYNNPPPALRERCTEQALGWYREAAHILDLVVCVDWVAALDADTPQPIAPAVGVVPVLVRGDGLVLAPTLRYASLPVAGWMVSDAEDLQFRLETLRAANPRATRDAMVLAASEAALRHALRLCRQGAGVWVTEADGGVFAAVQIEG